MKYCNKCGSALVDEAIMCPFCGCAVEEDRHWQKPEPTNGFAIAGFVFSFLIPIFGWIFSGIGLSHSKKMNGKGRGLSIAGLVITSVLFVFYVVLLILMV